MQTTDKMDLPLRSRYYQGMIDLDTLQRNDSFRKLRKWFIIFVCTEDFIGRRRCVYTFRRRCDEDLSIVLDDKSTVVFLSPEGANKDEIDSHLRALLDYIKTGKPCDEFTRRVQSAVDTAKNKKEWRMQYMTYEMAIKVEREDAYKEGSDNKATRIAERMLKNGYPLDAVESMTELSEAEVLKIKEELSAETGK